VDVTALLQVPLVALQFAANNVFLSLAPSPPPGQQPSHLSAFVCGGAAGISSFRVLLIYFHSR
jgi:hypothetical protein